MAHASRRKTRGGGRRRDFARGFEMDWRSAQADGPGRNGAPAQRGKRDGKDRYRPARSGFGYLQSVAPVTRGFQRPETPDWHIPVARADRCWQDLARQDSGGTDVWRCEVADPFGHE